MGADDLWAKLAIASVLIGPELSKIKPFTIKGHVTAANFFATVVAKMQLGYIDAKSLTGSGGKAYYNSTEGCFYLDLDGGLTLAKKALIVHEATHALSDIVWKIMDIGTSESIAYVAQCQFARANNPDPDPEVRLYGDTAAEDKVFECGWHIAGKLLAGDTPTESDYKNLYDAVDNHPYYKGQAAKPAGYDGVYLPSAVPYVPPAAKIPVPKLKKKKKPSQK